MTTSLSTSLQQLDISDSSQPHTASEQKLPITSKPKPPVRRMWLSQPPGVETAVRFQFYAFETSERWLLDFARPRVKNGDTWHRSTLVQAAVDLLERESGFKGLKMEVGSLGTPPSATGYGDSFVPLLSVCTTEDTASYYRRPTQAQINKLTELMGRKPQWWTDYHPLEYYM